MLMVCIRIYIKSLMRYTFLILDTCYLDSVYLHEQGSEGFVVIFRSQKEPDNKKVWETQALSTLA